MMAELADRERVAAGSVAMAQRCAGAIGRTARVRLSDGSVAGGVLCDVGPDWLLLDQQGPGELLVALRAVTAIEGLTAATGNPLSELGRRLDLRLALRGIARDRAPVLVTVAGPAAGPDRSSPELGGTVDRVGMDFLEVAQHPAWEPRRPSSVRSVVLIPLAGVLSVRSIPAG